ncbi:MAG: FtsH protease activity modulator HflK [Pseudomonadota bacterium]
MPSNNNSGGPWGGGGGGNRGQGGNDGGDRQNPWGGGGNRGGGGGGGGQGPGNVPDIDEIVRKGQEQLKVLIGGRGGRLGGGGDGFNFGWGGAAILGGAVVVAWLFASVYTVQDDQRSVELTLGEFSSIGTPGLNFAPWPVVTHEILTVTRENTIEIGAGGRGDQGLMLTGDENIVDIDFQIVWNIADPAAFKFNLAEPELTIRSVAESAMREVISRSELAPILNRDRGIVANEVLGIVQATLDSYDSGVNIVRLNLNKADPPANVIEAFRDVQAAEQERSTLQNEADRDANRTLADARGEAARLLQGAEAYRAQVVNAAQGEASRFVAVYDEYIQAQEVTRKRLFLETMESVFGDVNKVIIDETVAGAGEGGGTGVVPFLPLNDLSRPGGNR